MSTLCHMKACVSESGHSQVVSWGRGGLAEADMCRILADLVKLCACF